MQPGSLNFRHLYYFWVVAQEGSVTRAAERLGVAVQTISTQLGLLEQALGKSLLAPHRRRLAPTEAGRAALAYADQIFLLAEQMQAALADSGAAVLMRLTVGISNSLPKLIAYRLLEAALRLPQAIKLVCYEDQFESLLTDLALHKLDVVLADRPVSPGTALRVFSHLLGESELTLFGAPDLAQRYRPGFPDSLDGAPLLLPTRNNAMRGRIEQWLDAANLQPQVTGEFEDNALLNTFGRSGLGLFFAPTAMAGEVADQLGALPIGTIARLREPVYAISSERKIRHPAVEAILSAPHGGLFARAEQAPGSAGKAT